MENEGGVNSLIFGFRCRLVTGILYNQTMALAAKTVSFDITKLLERLTRSCREHYGDRLISLAVFGSVGRGTPHPGSDVDLLLVVNNLPEGRIARVRDFAAVENALAASEENQVELSPIFKTPEEIERGTPLLLDMVEDARMLFDRDDFLKCALKNLNDRLQRLGARRIWQGNAWYWDLKPDYKAGEIFEV